MARRFIITDKITHYRTDRIEHITHVDQPLYNIIATEYPEIVSHVKKYSRSVYDKQFHMESLQQYDRDVNTLDDIRSPYAGRMKWAYEQAKSVVASEFKTFDEICSLNVLEDLDVVEFNCSSSAGYSYQGKKGLHRGPNHMKAIKISRAIVGDIRDAKVSILQAVKNLSPYVGHTRTQLTEYLKKLKVRHVWGVDFHTFLIGALSAQPWTNFFCETDNFYEVGKDPRIRVPQILLHMRRIGIYKQTGDWRFHDASTKEYEIRAAFEMFKSKTKFRNRQSEIAFDFTRESFICKRVTGPFQRLIIVNTGTPSGHPWTQLIGSTCSRIRTVALFILTHKNRIPRLFGSTRMPHPKFRLGNLDLFLKNQGDDSASATNHMLDIDFMAEWARLYDWPVNPDKYEQSLDVRNLEFLQRTVRGTDHFRDMVRCFLLLILPEHPQVTEIISAYRSRALAEDQGGYSRVLNTLAELTRHLYAPKGFTGLVIPKMYRMYVPGLGHVRRIVKE
jgi:hypothetical protein